MKLSLSALVVATLLSFSAVAASPNQVDFSKIRFDGMQVLNSDNEDAFGYKLKIVNRPTAALVQTLENESYSTVVSPIYELDQKSAFRNIYVYIGKTAEGTFEFVEAFINSHGNFAVVDMNITNVEKDHLDLVHGPSDGLRTYKVISSQGNLFP